MTPGTGMVIPALPWALGRIAAGRAVGRLPRYGSPDWERLPARDPRRWAAVLVAAEMWRDFCSEERVALDLRQALRAEDRTVVARLKAASVDVSLAADWRAIANIPTHAELVQRRAS